MNTVHPTVLSGKLEASGGEVDGGEACRGVHCHKAEEEPQHLSHLQSELIQKLKKREDDDYNEVALPLNNNHRGSQWPWHFHN